MRDLQMEVDIAQPLSQEPPLPLQIRIQLLLGMQVILHRLELEVQLLILFILLRQLESEPLPFDKL